MTHEKDRIHEKTTQSLAESSYTSAEMSDSQDKIEEFGVWKVFSAYSDTF